MSYTCIATSSVYTCFTPAEQQVPRVTPPPLTCFTPALHLLYTCWRLARSKIATARARFRSATLGRARRLHPLYTRFTPALQPRYTRVTHDGSQAYLVHDAGPLCRDSLHLTGYLTSV